MIEAIHTIYLKGYMYPVDSPIKMYYALMTLINFPPLTTLCMYIL